MSTQTKPTKPAYIIIALLVAIGTLIVLLNREEPNDKEPVQQQQISNKTTDFKQGTFNDQNNVNYSYQIVTDNKGKYAALFQPFLPRDDDTVVLAMLELLKVTYGDDTRIGPTPKLVERDSKNYITFTGTNSVYHMLIIKEDTGETNSVSYWKE